MEIKHDEESFEIKIKCECCESENCFWYIDNGYCLIVGCKDCGNEYDFGQ